MPLDCAATATMAAISFTMANCIFLPFLEKSRIVACFLMAEQRCWICVVLKRKVTVLIPVHVERLCTAWNMPSRHHFFHLWRHEPGDLECQVARAVLQELVARVL